MDTKNLKNQKDLKTKRFTKLTFDHYDQIAELTDHGDRAQKSMGHPWLYYVLGCCDEAGELAGKVKKLYRDHDGILTDEYRLLILKEIGDQLWYMSRLARKLGTSLSEIAHLNNEKLLGRLERGTIHGDGDNR